MGRVLRLGIVVIFSLVACASAALAQSRNALVIGNSAYQGAPALKTPATDAAIVAETLRAAGYDVTELHDVKQSDTGQTMRDFLDKVAAGGAEGAAIVYYSGYAAQSDGENFLVPVDAVINSDSDVANETFRLNDLLEELAKTPLAARIVVLDASRDHKFGVAGGKPVAKGLAMGDTVPGTLLAFAAAPGAISIDGDGDYSLYTGALVTMMRQPGLDIEQIFKATRLQVNQATAGEQTPWMVADLSVDVTLFAATAAAPESQTAPSGAAIPSKEERVVTKDLLRTLSPDDAYAAAVEEDSLEAYQWFVELYPKSQLAPQVWDIIETRREAVLWRRTLAQNTTRAYWNYLKRYPNGAHAGEAQDQLAALSAARAPPPNYVAVPEPLPEDYSDEAVGLVEIVPEGYDAPPSVFDLLGPLFIPRGPRDFTDRRRNRDRFIPNIIPNVRGDPVSSFTNKKDKTDKTVKTDKTGKTDKTKTGITQGNKDKGTKKPGVDSTTTTATKGKDKGNKKTGVTLPTTKPGTTTGRPTTPGTTTGRPTTPGTVTPGTTTGRPTTPGTTTGRPTTPGTPTPGTTTGRPTKPGLTIPGTTTGRPTTPGTVTPGTTTGRPTTPGTVTPGTTTGRPTTPGTVTPGTTTGRPATPGTPTPGTTTGRPTIPGTAIPGTTTGRPTTPGTTTGRPGLPPVPGTTPGRPTTPTTTVPSVGQRPGLPPTTPTVRPPTPTTPTVRPPTPTPTSPTVRPPTPTTPTVRPTTPPTVRPTPPPVTRPTPPPVRPTPPTVRPTPPRPTPPVARPAPPRPAPVARPAPPRPAPVARPLPPRPAPVARPAPPRPAPVARPAPPPRPAPVARPAPPPPRAPVCTVVGGKRVCR